MVRGRKMSLPRQKLFWTKLKGAQIKAFCKAVDAKRMDVAKVQKRLKKELCKEVRVKAKTRAN